MRATIYGQELNLAIPADADKFVAAYRGDRQQAVAEEYAREFDYANRVLYDAFEGAQNIRWARGHS